MSPKKSSAKPRCGPCRMKNMLMIVALVVAIVYGIYALAPRTTPPPPVTFFSPEIRMVSERPLSQIEPVRYLSPENTLDYKNIGYLQNGDDQRPLWAARSHTRSQRWHYYTTNDPKNESQMVRIPISSSGKNCMDEIGCDEIYRDDVVSVQGSSGSYTSHIY